MFRPTFHTPKLPPQICAICQPGRDALFFGRCYGILFVTAVRAGRPRTEKFPPELCAFCQKTAKPSTKGGPGRARTPSPAKMKRKDYINWDEYFMGIALLSAMRSKDPNSQVGACIVSPENKILSLGYNGMPIGCDDDAMPWEREGAPLDTKYMYVCHAELNAILNSAHNNLKGARIYVTLFPCNECTKAIIQSGIGEIVYYDDKYHDSDSSVAARFMLKKAGVHLTPYHPSGREVTFTL